MAKHVISWVGILVVLTGCTSMYVGPRMGFDVSLSGASTTSQVQETITSSSGVAAGAWLGIHLPNRLSIELAPGVLSQQQRVLRKGTYTDDGVDVLLDGYQTTSISLFDVPVNVRYAFTPQSSRLRPYALAGVGYQSARSRRYQLSGTAIIEGVEWPFFDENTRALTLQRTSLTFSAGGGVEYALSKTWHVRSEISLVTRARAITSGAGLLLVGYDAFDKAMYYDFAVTYPRTSLGLHFGIVGYF